MPTPPPVSLPAMPKGWQAPMRPSPAIVSEAFKVLDSTSQYGEGEIVIIEGDEVALRREPHAAEISTSGIEKWKPGVTAYVKTDPNAATPSGLTDKRKSARGMAAGAAVAGVAVLAAVFLAKRRR